ncbi:MAG: molybdenum cofactor guanylyltransferase [Candidatus Promineifilaceae bacterium]
MNLHKTTVVIQAGGRSSRMGRDKGLVPLAGKPMIEHIIERVAGLGDALHLITNHPENYAYLNLPIGSDAEPGAGALPGLQTALSAVESELVLLIACDMPFVNRALLAFQLAQAAEADVVVPVWEGYHQPMHAVYRRDVVLAAVERVLARNQRRMVSFYKDVRVREISAETITRFDPLGHTFYNVNTPADLLTAEQLLMQKQD